MQTTHPSVLCSVSVYVSCQVSSFGPETGLDGQNLVSDFHFCTEAIIEKEIEISLWLGCSYNKNQCSAFTGRTVQTHG